MVLVYLLVILPLNLIINLKFIFIHLINKFLHRQSLKILILDHIFYHFIIIILTINNLISPNLIVYFILLPNINLNINLL